MAYTVEDIRDKVLAIIEQYRSDVSLWIDSPKIELTNVMYTHGASDEFDAMTADLEQEFDIHLDADIGELTVQAFIDRVTEGVRLQVLGY